MATDRMPPIPKSALDSGQQKAAAQFEAVRNMPPFGPFVPLLRSPEVMQRAAALGDYLRFRNSLPRRLSELAILITARAWTQQLEWHYHAGMAREAGLAEEIIAAVAEGRRPENLDEEAAAVLDFSLELHRNRSVSDATYAKAKRHFGEKGVIDLVGIAGYYSLLAMAMNVARTPLPEGVTAPLTPMP